MDSKNLNIVVTDNETQDSISFPVTPKKLGQFISGLLGQSQSIEREVSGTFDIDLTWFIHVHALIEQRISQQNEATRTAFKATIYYDDKLTRTLETYEAFEHFSETKKIRSTGAKLEWSYLIRFPGKELPEKQEISLQVLEKGSRFVMAGLPLVVPSSSVGLIKYSISHTERTWGDDVETILRQEIEQVIQKNSWYEKYGEGFWMLIGFACLIGGFLYPEFMNDRLENQAYQQLQLVINKISPIETLPKLELTKKLDVVITLLDSKYRIPKVGGTYRAISAVAGVILFALCIYLTELRRSSFVVLTREAEIYKKRTQQKERRRLLVAVVSFLGTIVSGVIGNHVYLLMTAA